MPMLIGAATAAATLLSMALGQINTGFEAFGVLLASIVLMTHPARIAVSNLASSPAPVRRRRS